MRVREALLMCENNQERAAQYLLMNHGWIDWIYSFIHSLKQPTKYNIQYFVNKLMFWVLLNGIGKCVRVACGAHHIFEEISVTLLGEAFLQFVKKRLWFVQLLMMFSIVLESNVVACSGPIALETRSLRWEQEQMFVVVVLGLCLFIVWKA